MNRFNHKAAIQRERRYIVAFRVGFASLVLSLAFAQFSVMRELDWAMPTIAVPETVYPGDGCLQKFGNCSVPPPSHIAESVQVPIKFKTNASSSATKKTCALLFFGLAKKFRSIILPSIQEYILSVSDNSRCDIYIHNYNVSTISNPRANEFTDDIDPTEVFDLTPNVVMDTEQTFKKARDMRHYAHPDRKPYRSMGWDKTALLNMYKQWHSIERVWDLMQETERKLNIQYERVAFFRSDVKYVTPIDIFDGDAVIPKFGFLVNDRMFYGLYEHAHVWAKIRYPSVECYVPRHYTIKMHSEFFMNDLVLKNIPNVEKKDICFYRVRGNGQVWEDDCTKYYEFPPHLVELNLTCN